MAKENALAIYLANGSTKDKLTESYAELIDMIQKGAVSQQIKNTNLSGDPESGSVEARRMATSVSADYGTARTVGGAKLKNNGVTVNLDTDKEIVEEVEWKDINFYGIDGLLAKRQNNHLMAMIRELDTAFFTEAVAGGTEVTLESTAIEEQIEELIQAVETTTNGNVDGVDRSMIVVTVKPSIYGALRNKIDTLPNPADGGVDIKTFHDVRIFSNHRQTKDAICMVVGSVAQPVVSAPYDMERVPLSNAIAVELYYSYGTKAVMPDLIKYAEVLSPVVSG